ncbi:MAG: hypothetical protein QXZ41_06095 [Ignisphaera sp.]
MEKNDVHTIVITYLAVAVAVLAIFLAISQKYVASIVSLASALTIFSFISEKRCKD